MPRFFWNLEAFRVVLEQKQALNAAFFAIRTKIESRPIQYATPGELIKMTLILKQSKKLQKELEEIAGRFEREI